jgi:hypothetical protein
MAGGPANAWGMDYDRSLVASWVFRDGTRAGAVALPTMTGRTNFGTFGPDRVCFVIAVEKAAQHTLSFVHSPG